MADEEIIEETETPRSGVGDQLRAAREKKGLTLDQVSAQTRISDTYLAAIEAGDFDALPGRTYALGFSRTYAKAMGLNHADVAQLVREEMGYADPDRRHRTSFEPGDPARAPTGRLVWFSMIALILLVVGLFFAARVLFAPAAELPSLIVEQEAEEAAAAKAAQAKAAKAGKAGDSTIDASGAVVFTAQGPSWVRFYDAQGRVLMEKEMAEGESYTVPADAEGPQIITGRPDLLAITIGGKPVPKLSEELETLTDIPVSAEALLARSKPAPAASASPAPAAQN